MKILVTDIETNGLLKDVTKFHCAWIKNKSTEEWTGYRPDDFKRYLEDLHKYAEEGYLITFHNGIGYDYPALDKLKKLEDKHGITIPKENILDTLILSRLLYPDIKESDLKLHAKGKLPAKAIGKHSLKAWGFRLGILKGTYGEQEDAWAVFTEEMYQYCHQDVEVTDALVDLFLKNDHYFKDGLDTTFAIRLEHDVAWLMAQQERNGFPFDERGANKLYGKLKAEATQAEHDLVARFGSWYAVTNKAGSCYYKHSRTGKPMVSYHKVFYPKVGGTYLSNGKIDARDTFKDAPYTPMKKETFKPSSLKHLIKVLKELGWEPIEFTEKGQPKVDEEALEGIILESEADQQHLKAIQHYLMLKKRIAQIAEGKQAWLKNYNPITKCIHGAVITNGTVTGRASHNSPNVGQVVAKGKAYGKECRQLWGVVYKCPDWYQVGTDASGLELRMLGHFLYPYDGGEYIKLVLEGDVHWANAKAAGLAPEVERDKDNPEHDGFRDNAKTFIYGFLYGAGAAKAGKIVHKDATHGKKLIKRFLNKTPAIKNFRDAVQKKLVKSSTWSNGKQIVKWLRKWIRGIDGRKVPIRFPHAAVNTILQSAGSLVCKLWLVYLDKILREEYNLKHGWDGDFVYMAWVHDELQIAARTKEIAEIIGKASDDAIKRVGKFFGIRCELATEYNVGKTWYDCH